MYWCYRKFKNCVLSIVGDVRIQGDLSMNGVINVIDANNSTTGMISVTNDGPANDDNGNIGDAIPNPIPRQNQNNDNVEAANAVIAPFDPPQVVKKNS